MDISVKVKKSVEALPEIYQTIYGHPEYNNESSRKCSDREPDITKIVKNYQDHVNKKDIKVLDIGCAQGYYSFTLQAMGCQVQGIDYNEDNVNCCNTLKEENGLQCQFKHAKIDMEFIDSFEDDSFDVILILSVIHHISNEHGFEYARNLMTKLARKAKVVITELAVKEEPLFWNVNLPESYAEWFDDVAFFDEIAFKQTHLSEVIRPLLIYSDRYVYLDGVYYSIAEYLNKSFSAKKDNKDRRYCFCDDLFFKIYRGKQASIFAEMEKEAQFCEQYSDVMNFVPKMIYWRKNDASAIAGYKIIKGKNLWDCIKDGDEIDYKQIFIMLLEQLIELEQVGLFHGDLRIWNVCVKNGKDAYLIDFGNMQETKYDLIAESFMPSSQISVYDAFVTLVYDCITKEQYKTLEYHDVYEVKQCYKCLDMPEEYAAFIREYLLADAKTISYAKIKEMFLKTIVEKNYHPLSVDERLLLNELKVNRLIDRSVSYAELLSVKMDVEACRSDIYTFMLARIQELNNKQAHSEAIVQDLQAHNEAVVKDLQAQIRFLLNKVERISQELQDKDNRDINQLQMLENRIQEQNQVLQEQNQMLQMQEQRIIWLENTFEQRAKRKIKKILKRN